VQKIRANNSSAENISGFAVIDKIVVQQRPVSGLAIGPDGKLIVTHYGDDSFSMIDIRESAPVQTTVGVTEPFAVAVSDTPRGRAYISTVSAAYDSILAFDTATSRILASHPLAHSVADLAVSPDGRYVYASRTAAHGVDVAILDTETDSEDAIGIAADAGSTAGCLRVSPDGRLLFVAVNAPCAAGLVVIDTQSGQVRNSFEIGCPIRDIALTPDGATAYIASCGPDFGVVLDVLDIRGAATDTYKLGEIAGLMTQLALSRDGKRAYLVGDAGVTVLSTATHDVIGTIALGAQPSCVTESWDGTRLYIADYAGGVTALTTGSAAAANPDEAPTAAHRWAFAEQQGLEPTPV
jgi:DNA-binding beta-propeller fold protein YncE